MDFLGMPILGILVHNSSISKRQNAIKLIFYMCICHLKLVPFAQCAEEFWGSNSTPTWREQSQVCLVDNHGLRLGEADSHPNRFTFGCTSPLWVLKVVDRWSQQNHVMCKKHCRNFELSKPNSSRLRLEFLTANKQDGGRGATLAGDQHPPRMY